ncbi:hypothetical protein H9Q72_013366 [Fusarium xylarioides]|uniref:Uncharacterized protein n=1 Tax=Fusarium xylarioides TaxID=221167 RepID=A0A9P7HJ63_9HYPO|nr:hypothetical protein H9Q72_013366 [Fusarium xylarioides]
MHTVRRSLQTPDPDKPYLTEGPNATEMKDMIDQAISSGDHYKLYDEAIEILKAAGGLWLRDPQGHMASSQAG